MIRRLQTIELILLSALLLLLPLVFDVSLFQAFVLPKKLIFDSLSSLLLVAWSVRFCQTREISWPDNKLFAALVIVWPLILILSALNSDVPAQAWFGSALRAFGSQTNLLLFLIFLWSAANHELIKDRIQVLTVSAAVSGGITSLYGLVQVAGLDPLQGAVGRLVRASSTLGQPNFFGSFLLPVIFVSAYGISISKNTAVKVLHVGALLLELAALVFTLSRGAWLGLAVTGLVFILTMLYEKSKTGFKVAAFVVIVGASAWLLLGLSGRYKVENFEKNSELIKRAVSLVDFSQVSLRGYYYQAAWQLVKARPFLGYGADTSGYYFFPFYSGKWSIFEVINRSTDKAHNFWLDASLEFGALGFVWFVLLFGLFLYAICKTGKSDRLALAAAGASLAILLSWQVGFQTLETSLWFWLLSGLLLGQAISGKKKIIPDYQLIVILIAVSVIAAVSVAYDMSSYRSGRTYYKLLAAQNNDAVISEAKNLLGQASFADLKSYYAANVYSLLSPQVERREINETDLKYFLNQLEQFDSKPYAFEYKLNRLIFLTNMANVSLGQKRGEALAMQLEKEFAEFKKTAPNHAVLELTWGNLAYYRRAYPEALRHYQTALKLYPDLDDKRINDEHRSLIANEKALVYYRLAWYYKTVGQWKDAFGSINEALALSKTDNYMDLQKEIKTKIK